MHIYVNVIATHVNPDYLTMDREISANHFISIAVMGSFGFARIIIRVKIWVNTYIGLY